MMRRFAGAAIVVAAVAGCPRVASANQEVMGWIVNGVARSAIVYAPAPGEVTGPLPLILAFHGHGDEMRNFQNVLLHRRWPAAIVVYFQGLPTRDDLPGWQVEKGQENDRDLHLVDVALASLRKKFTVDDQRIYATGFSNGAGFTYLLWAERPNVFAAFAAVAGRMSPSVRPTEPRPVLHVAGVRENRISFASQQETIELAKDVNGSTGRETSCGEGCTIFSGVAQVLTLIHQGGHSWTPKSSGLIAQFFQAHALAQ